MKCRASAVFPRMMPFWIELQFADQIWCSTSRNKRMDMHYRMHKCQCKISLHTQVYMFSIRRSRLYTSVCTIHVSMSCVAYRCTDPGPAVLECSRLLFYNLHTCTFMFCYLRDTTTVPFIVVGCNLLQHL